MVASIAAVGSAGAAASYYEADDYYAEGGLAPSAWAGAGAASLDLKGDVDRDAFKALLEGKVDGRALGTVRDGVREHRPGWDITLSAPKSVSILSEVAGDRRLVAAHGRAVQVALGHIEMHMAATRVRDEHGVARQATGNLVIASFQHGTSRAQDPQLHTHNVILNMTKGADGTWRSLEPRALYQLQKQIGAIYRQELANEVRTLGYGIVAGKDSTFEIAGVPQATLDAFSQRSAAIEAALAERGETRATASAAAKQVATLDTRDAKKSADRQQLIRDWRASADASGFDQAARRGLVHDAEASARDVAPSAMIAEQSVRRAIAMLEERQSVFAASQLQQEAGRIALGSASYASIQVAVAGATTRGDIEPRTFIDRRGAEFEGFASRASIESERRLLAIERAGRGGAPAIANLLEAHRGVAHSAAVSAKQGFVWNDEQRAAAVAILTSRNRVSGLQGYAGTAKTSTVVGAVSRQAASAGYDVRALAPTASAAMVLGDALGTRADTVARHLMHGEGGASGRPRLWIVDEASLLSARDMARLLGKAEAKGARVLLVGDTKQLGSVEAGVAFAQLQAACMQTAKLTTIVRQTDAEAQATVIAALAGDARRALSAIESGKGEVREHGDREARFAAIATAYAALSEVDRKRTLVIEPSREGRDALTADIRSALAEAGVLSGPTLSATALAAKGLTREEARDARSYAPGDVVVFRRDFAAKGVTKGARLEVRGTDAKRGAVRLASGDKTIEWQPRRWGASTADAFEAKPLALQAGDRIQFTRNDKANGRVNGQHAQVAAVDVNAQTAEVKIGRRTETLRLVEARDQHVRHAYVETAFAAQGRTADRVMIHADSRATNLIDQRSFYVAISRARQSVTLVTDDSGRLVRGISERAGLAQTALAMGASRSSSAAL